MAIDLEMNQPSEKIIQIGVVIGNINSGEILKEKSYSIKIDEPLNPYIISLTKITDENLQKGISLLEAYNELKIIHKEYNCFINPITWGGGDSQELRIQLGLEKEKFLFGRRWIDAKTLYCSYRIANKQFPAGGLAKALTNLKLKFKGQKHNALDDARNTFIIYYNLIKKLKD